MKKIIETSRYQRWLMSRIRKKIVTYRDDIWLGRAKLAKKEVKDAYSQGYRQALLDATKLEAVTHIDGQPTGWVSTCPHCLRTIHYAREATDSFTETAQRIES